MTRSIEELRRDLLAIHASDKLAIASALVDGEDWLHAHAVLELVRRVFHEKADLYCRLESDRRRARKESATSAVLP